MANHPISFEEALTNVLGMSDEEISALPSDPVWEDVFATIASMEEVFINIHNEKGHNVCIQR